LPSREIGKSIAIFRFLVTMRVSGTQTHPGGSIPHFVEAMRASVTHTHAGDLPSCGCHTSERHPYAPRWHNFFRSSHASAPRSPRVNDFPLRAHHRPFFTPPLPAIPFALTIFRCVFTVALLATLLTSLSPRGNGCPLRVYARPLFK
jgi:hypothetical protein